MAVPSVGEHSEYLTLAVTRAPGLTERVTCYQPMERPHATRITLSGDAAVKEISNSDAFYSQFGNSFKAIKVKCEHLTLWANVAQLAAYAFTQN